ncbi:tripartite tricarboxylate transporter TctB family protein [Chelativorans sp. AA-79]|uniref:tripartite tricarboxylate transporter TctB family protein n=1 Tax=Chelativorans sp. AA-79 TaxID=3028735 RepID=UPI0023F9A968|nr:tripartite tricarboxylate transporter TctB family protein [Chelativorans sp. AA-79]WEX12462.1 tripartite tricarboxylate transporter TctB family protein [Chelativorans sp. AA-79]
MIKNEKDLGAGLMFAALGVPMAYLSTSYRMGTSAEMGPGYFPFLVGCLLAFVGSILIVKALLRKDGKDTNKIARFDLRSLGIITLSIVLFSVALDYLGLVAAVAALVIVSSFASHEFNWRATLANTAFLIVFTILVFVVGLGVQLEIWPPFMTN